MKRFRFKIGNPTIKTITMDSQKGEIIPYELNNVICKNPHLSFTLAFSKHPSSTKVINVTDIETGKAINYCDWSAMLYGITSDERYFFNPVSEDEDFDFELIY